MIARWVQVLAACAAPTLAACRIPDAPEWEIDTTLPAAIDTFSWIDFLPPAVDTATVDGDKVFVIGLPQNSTDYRLSNVCTPCRELQGQTVMIPAFEFADSLDVRFPDELYSIEVRRGVVESEVESNLPFSLLDERIGSDDPVASLIVRDLGSGATLDSLASRPGADSLPPFGRWQVSLSLSTTITEGIRLILRLSYPGSEATVEVDTTQSVRLLARSRGLEVWAVTVVVNDAEWEEEDDVDLDQGLRDEIVDHYRGGSIEVLLTHSLEAVGDLEISVADTRSNLFSGNPDKEVRFPGLAFTSGLWQAIDLTEGQVETIASFPNPFVVGYRGVANGTGTAPGDWTHLTRISADQFAHVLFRLRSRLRVGG